MTNTENTYRPTDLAPGDTLERRIAPFTIKTIAHRLGGWDGKQPLIALESTTGERLTYHTSDRVTVPVTRAARREFCHEAHEAGPARTRELGATCGRCGGDRARPTR